MKVMKQVHPKAGVSVITVTNKPEFIKNIFRNYRHQSWDQRELIIVLNHHNMKPSTYRAYARRKGIQAAIYQLPESLPLGVCLNYGIKRARYPYIAKFDDDDYYGPAYLAEAVRTAEWTGADVVGKNRFYMYMMGSKELLLLTKRRKDCVAGATLVFRKKLFPAVKFTRRRAGSDMKFLADIWKRGGVVRTTSHRHFVAVRRADQSKHTWKFNRNAVRNMRAEVVARTVNYERLVRRGKI
ncbi:glycosyltransferase involved in cell wall biosynthesis [Bacillus sp. 3255]|nr:glycosyltransferase involved in cell wall biosynthesis [Bacillus sp. 3255]